MKKYIRFMSMGLTLLCMALCFAACFPTQPEVDLNALLDKDYSALELEVKTEHPEGTLINTYNVSESSDGVLVEYSCQSFAQLSLSDKAEERIVTAVGSVLYKDGETVSETGDKVLYALPKSVRPALDLSLDNMSNIKLADGKLTADVVNPSKLFGLSSTATDMKISVEYTDEAIGSIVISYVSDSASVTLTFRLK